MRRNKYLATFLILGAFLFSLFAGCSAQKKPMPEGTAPEKAPAIDENRSQARARDAADDISRRVLKISGVKSAYVVVVGNVALIGINIEGGKQEKGINDIKNEAADRAEADKRIVRAYVSADPDIVARIREISDNVRKGRPLTEYLDEIGEIIQRLTPKTNG